MYSKIALGNVKKSFKDYSIYFLTLTLAVSIFYSFNSIESQKAILEMDKSNVEYIEALIQLVGGLSIFVSVILGSLILYANNFLIKRRKKELGIYMTLGMSKYKISKILVIETLIVGLASLVSGLLLGLLLSQGLSLFTAKLFEVGMNEYKFIISSDAIFKTVLYFGIIFLLVMIFNTLIISKYKIIDMLNASKKIENIKFKNPIIYVITFIICILSLAIAYYLIIDIGLMAIEDPKFVVSIILGILGTVLFFYSLSGAFTFLITKNKNIYLKNLNIFIVKQINSKVNTNFVSMSVICLMLFLTIGILSTGLSLKSALESGLKATTPFDASANMYIDEDSKVQSIEESLNKLGFKFNKNEDYITFNIYESKLDMKDTLNKNLNKSNEKLISKMYNTYVDFISLSDYNKIRNLNHQDDIKLLGNEIILMSNNNQMVNIVNDFLEDNSILKIDDKVYNIKNQKAVEESLTTTGMASNLFTVVVPDNAVKGLKAVSNNLNVNFTGSKEEKEKSEERFNKIFDSYIPEKVDFEKVGFVYGVTKAGVYAENKGVTTSMLFLGIYLGIVFLISSMAVLSLQQLSEASDSIDRYKSLKRIGANDKMINRTIFIQTLIYFTLPIGLALIHSIVGIKIINDFVTMFNKPNISSSSIMTAILFLIIYAGYFFATYTGYKNIIKNS